VTPLDPNDLRIGTVIRWVRGDHAGLLTEVRRFQGNNIELRILPGQRSHIGSGSDKKTRYSMRRESVGLSAVIERQPRTKQAMPPDPSAHLTFYSKPESVIDAAVAETLGAQPPVRAAAEAVAQLGQGDVIELTVPAPQSEPEQEQGTVTPASTGKHKLHIKKAEMLEAFEGLVVTAEVLRRGIAKYGINGTADRLNVGRNLLRDALPDLGIKAPGHGMQPSDPGSTVYDAELNKDVRAWVAEHRQSHLGAKNGPVVVHKPTPTVQTPENNPFLRPVAEPKQSSSPPPALQSHIELLEQDETRLTQQRDALEADAEEILRRFEQTKADLAAVSRAIQALKGL
jgi:hypothetical protein